MTQPEGRLGLRIQAALRGEGYFVFKVHGNEYTMAGLPDLIVCVEGIFVALEIKLPRARANVSEIQKLRHEQIRKAGGYVCVVCSATEAIDFCDYVQAAQRQP